MTNDSELQEEELPRRRGYSTVANPVSMHDMVTIAYDDWDDIFHASRTVTTISPGLPDDLESL